MKKAFTLMEVIISVVLLSVVMMTLLQIKSDNIFLVSKSDEKDKLNDYVLMAINFNDKILEKNEKIYIDKNYIYKNKKIIDELKDKEVMIKDEKLEEESIKMDELKRNSLNFVSFYRIYSLENSDVKKRIYTFKFEL